MRLFGFDVDASTRRALDCRVRAVRRRRAWSTWLLAAGRRRLGRRQRAAALPGAGHERRSLDCVDVTKSFGPTQIIRGVSLEIAGGERHAIIGPNGAGKSTLFHLISGRIRPTSGEIRLHGERIDRPRSRSRSIAAACRAASRSPTSSRSCRSTRICAAPRSGRSATDTRSGGRSTACATFARRAEWLMEQIGLDRAPRRAGGRADLRRAAGAGNRRHDRRRRGRRHARRTDRGHEQQRDRAGGRADPQGDAKARRW